ncbi:MAG: bifunctional DNA-formamidopyrimidine glycosylase/DNA-(apurinic or apyrimidinic site) lyase [Asticcacaulis sp.]
MPELPEVETVRRGLSPHLEGATLSHVRLHRGNLRYDFPKDFVKNLDGATVLKLERRAKYLLAWLDTQAVWVTHLGMTGRFHIDDSPDALGAYHHKVTPDEKHLHVQMIATRPDGHAARIDFYDPRRFGFMLLMSPAELYEAKWYRSLGVEPLSDDLTPAYLLERAKGRAANLKALLMAQAGIAGLGNIYVCEALWRSRLDPARPSSSLKKTEAKALVEAVKAVLTEAVAAGGSSISDFTSTSGDLGYFQHRFNVYDRSGKPCLRNDGGIIARIVQQGRSTFFCPVCQK